MTNYVGLHVKLKNAGEFVSPEQRRQRITGYLIEHPDATRQDMREAGLGSDLQIAYRGRISDARRDAAKKMAELIPDVGYEILSAAFDGSALRITIAEDAEMPLEMSDALEDFRESIGTLGREHNCPITFGYRYSGDTIMVEPIDTSRRAAQFAAEFLRAYQTMLVQQTNDK